MVTKEEILGVSKVAKIAISDDEAQRFTKEINDTLCIAILKPSSDSVIIMASETFFIQFSVGKVASAVSCYKEFFPCFLSVLKYCYFHIIIIHNSRQCGCHS